MHLARLLDSTCYSGAGIFLSTPSDLVRFAMAMNSGKLLQPATVALLQTSQRLASGEDTGYGLGWKVKTVSLAGKPTRMAGQDAPPDKKVEDAFLVALSRRPTARERHLAEEHLQKITARFEGVNVSRKSAEEKALASLCQMLMATSEFLYVE